MSDRQVVRVRDVMTQDYGMVDGLTTIRDALAQFKAREASVLIINKRHEDDEFGILLISDIPKQVVAKVAAPAAKSFSGFRENRRQ